MRVVPTLTRRGVLVVTGGIVCSWGAVGCMHTNHARILTPPIAGGVVAVRLAEQPELAAVGGAIKLRPPGYDDTILLWRSSESEFAATSIVCTHFGCEVEVAEAGKSLACPCHGSQFAADGAVRHGPAKRPLRRYVVEPRGPDLLVRIA